MSDHDHSADDAAVVSAEHVQVAVDRAAWKADLWDWLERGGRRAGLPSLVIGIAALCLSAASLSYVVASYRLAVAAKVADERHLQIRDQLAGFMAEGAQIIVSCTDNSTPPKWRELNAWINKVSDYLKANLGASYAVRLVSAAGVPVNVSCNGADADHDKLFKVGNAVNFHLEQFSSESASWR